MHQLELVAVVEIERSSDGRDDRFAGHSIFCAVPRDRIMSKREIEREFAKRLRLSSKLFEEKKRN